MAGATGATRVGIGLIARGGRVLIRRRPPRPGSPMPGLWEFPGGKCEPGESPEAAAARECREETGLLVEIGRRRRVVTHRYPHGLVELHYFDARPADPGAEPEAGSGFIWAPVADLPNLSFPEANAPILAELASSSDEEAG
ncbi:(deoxy)nucleoside triphosphate pyrophosphohydrolase [Tautonia sociabilis]|uniref:8-oxo-dGTP diphosphatase n=1 Tax=Tautonia sociabilis TaxID=2080755 RepID=A0A432MH57_9BACT|nr:NUDIX domain-containing protein [Tautonia sociabilis]RUL86104.1 NUDIX domain-containing protein [Tautonia sociabilis]